MHPQHSGDNFNGFGKYGKRQGVPLALKKKTIKLHQRLKPN